MFLLNSTCPGTVSAMTWHRWPEIAQYSFTLLRRTPSSSQRVRKATRSFSCSAMTPSTSGTTNRGKRSRSSCFSTSAACWFVSALVNLVSATHRENLDEDEVIVDMGEDAIRTHPVAPFSRTVRGQSLTEDARIGTSIEVVLDLRCQDLGVEAVHFLELLTCLRVQLNAVGAGPR